MTTNLLLESSTAKLFETSTEAMVPFAIAGVDGIPRLASRDVSMKVSLDDSPNKACAVVLVEVIAMLDSSPVVLDCKLKVLFTESKVMDMPKR